MPKQRLSIALVAAITIASAPVVSPRKTPRIGCNSQAALTNGRSTMPSAIIARPATMVRRKPKRSMKPAENGPTMPKIISCTAIANEIVARLQPNSSSHGTISTEGAERVPAATSIARKLTATTIQP